MDNFIKLIEQLVQLGNESNLKKNLALLEKMICLLFNRIKQADTLEDAEPAFKVLEDIQFSLAKAVFKEGLVVRGVLRDFVKNFDRIDDEETRKFFYLKIKTMEWGDELNLL